ncbi:MAG TPA: ribosome assembly factor SBDS [Candidatus Altiarchaeales archaeon]|nr:ribosome assembly factor SBDS [Candidatus Altiarchaeales archaeon]
MTSLEDAVVARIKKAGETYEILVDAEQAYKYKAGDQVDLSDVLASEFVFKDAAKADKAAEENIQKFFQTTEITEIAKIILEKGEIQLTAEKKKQMLEAKRKQVVATIARNAINPQTKTPHPPERISKAMDEAKVHIELNKSAKEQVEAVMKAIRPIIPIKFETVQLAVKIPGMHAGKLYHMLREYGSVKKEEWKGENQYVVMEMPGGLQDEFYSQLNNRCHGEAEVKKID